MKNIFRSRVTERLYSSTRRASDEGDRRSGRRRLTVRDNALISSENCRYALHESALDFAQPEWMLPLRMLDVGAWPLARVLRRKLPGDL
jgi:hypothetical protein